MLCRMNIIIRSMVEAKILLCIEANFRTWTLLLSDSFISIKAILEVDIRGFGKKLRMLLIFSIAALLAECIWEFIA